MKKSLMTLFVILGLTTIAIPQTIPSYYPTSGLVGWWPFNGNANDESGNGNNGTVNGAILITDRYGNANSAYNFPLLDDRISLTNANALVIGDAITISFWMQFPSQFNSSTITMVGNIYSFPNGFSVNIDQNNGVYGANNYQMNFTISNNTVSFITNQNELGQWVNICAVYDGESMKIYMNDILKTTVAHSGNINSPNGNIMFATWSNPEGPIIRNRSIDDIAIWNRALSQQEIMDLYAGSSVGINEVSLSNLFSVYPNPANSQINVKADSKMLGSIYTVSDNTGRIVLSGKINSEKTVIELGNLQSGIYRLSAGDNYKETFKIIKD